MPERTGRLHAFALGAFALLAVGATTFGGVYAALGGWLAQPALALWLRDWRGRSNAAFAWPEALALAQRWGVALLLAGLLLAWPFASLLYRPSLGGVFGLSAAFGLGLVALWHGWAAWRAAETGDRQAWSRSADLAWTSWQGLGMAAAVALVLASVVLLAWPDALSVNARRGLALACLALWPALHAWLQREIAPVAADAQDEAGIDDEAPPAAPSPEPLPMAAMPAPDLVPELYAAARGGRVERTLELLDAGADAQALPPADERDQRLLPVLAAVLPDLRLLRALIARGVDLNHSHAGMTPLLAATRDSWHGRPEAVMTRLANGADARGRDRDGNTPLHHAARSSDPGVAALLRDAGAELDARNEEGVTPLGIACACGNWRLARFLLELGAKPEAADAAPALLSAAGGDDDDASGVQLLLKHKARVDSRDAQGRSALHAAARAGHAGIAQVLLEAGADARARDAEGRTPLLDAAEGGNVAVVDALHAAGAEIAAIDHAGRNALAFAALAELPSAATVRRLLELGADPQLAGADGRSPVDIAAAAGRWSLVSLLDPACPLPASVGGDNTQAPPPDRTPQSLLRDALVERRTEGLDALARLLAARELGELLHEPQLALRSDAIAWLLAHGADADTRDANGDVPALALLARGPEAIPAVQSLLRSAASPAGGGGLARFLAACAQGEHAAASHQQFALDLLERGADPFGASAAGDPPLALAVRLGWPQLCSRLIATGVDLDARDAHGMAALHLAAALGRESALKQLVAAGARPDLRAADGQTPLGVALAGGRRDLADWLDWRGWPLPRRALRASDLPAAAIVGDSDAVRRLLDLGFGIDTIDAQGCTALLRAAGGGHAATTELLLARGADPQCAANTGATPLSAAVSMRHVEIVERLLGAGASLEQRLPGEVTVLMLAAALGLPDVCARLLAAGAEVHAGDAQGLTPLHCATLYGFTARERPRLLALLDTLLLAGAEPDVEAAGGVTPLLLLLGARAEPGTACDEDVLLAALDHLLDEPVSLEARDPRGFGPLHLAALHGLLRVAQRLLRAGADPDLRDALNRRPREVALMRGFVDVAAELAPPAAAQPPSMARFLRE
jgi:ankyrin repeat protein